MTHGERLAAELRHAWNGNPWHGPSVAEILTRLSAREAAHRHVRGSHTPWELLRHLTTWVETPLRRFDDALHNPAETLDFPAPAEESDAQWQRDVAALGDAVERLARRVATMSDAELEAPVAERGYTYVRMVDGVVQHLAYHAGQIALLAKNEETPGIIMPPPVFVITAMLLAELLQRAVPVALPLPWWIGSSALAVSLVLACWSFAHFAMARTSPEPWRAARRLVVGGPYRLTRNPMYVSLLLLQAGLGVVRANAWYIAALLPAWYALHRGVVLREERYLLRRFGAPYQQMLDRTRRWFF